MLTAFLIAVALIIAVALFVDRRADLREAGSEAAFPVVGEVVQVNDCNVHVVVTGQGPDLVLLHGAGGNCRDFSGEFGRALAERYRVFAVDRPGFGWSGRADPSLKSHFTTEAESPAQQAQILAEATRRLGAKNPLIVGHSYGGTVALAWALNEPASGIVAVSGALMPWPGPLDLYYRFLGSTLGGFLFPPLISASVHPSQIDRTLDDVFAPQSVPQDYKTRAGIALSTRSETLRANARQVNSLRPHVVEMAGRYGTIDIPVELIHGDADIITPVGVHSQPASELISGANLTVLDGIGHMPHHVAQEAVIDAIDRAAMRAGLR